MIEKVQKLITGLCSESDIEFEGFVQSYGEFLYRKGYSLYDISDIITRLFHVLEKERMGVE